MLSELRFTPSWCSSIAGLDVNAMVVVSIFARGNELFSFRHSGKDKPQMSSVAT